jgi:hypothetical protein
VANGEKAVADGFPPLGGGDRQVEPGRRLDPGSDALGCDRLLQGELRVPRRSFIC